MRLTWTFRASALALATLACGCGRPAQLSSQECFDAVAQLRTAVLSRNMEMVDRAEQRLEQLAADGKLSGEARHTLQGIADAARGEHWTEAFEQLDQFQKGQRPKDP